MAKVVKPAAPKLDIELNRWCIEMAMRWPVITKMGYGNGVGGYQPNFPGSTEEADIISRAKKIKEWVKTA